MRQASVVIFNVATNVSGNSNKIDTSQVGYASVQVSFTDAAAAGTLKIQVSNDQCGFGNLAADFTPSNWNDLSGASVVVAAGATSVIAKQDMCWRWMRLVWTRTAGAGTFTATVNELCF